MDPIAATTGYNHS